MSPSCATIQSPFKFTHAYFNRQAFPIFLSCLHFQYSMLSLGLNFICKIKIKNYDLWSLLDIKVLIQQAKGVKALVVYCSGKSSNKVSHPPTPLVLHALH